MKLIKRTYGIGPMEKKIKAATTTIKSMELLKNLIIKPKKKKNNQKAKIPIYIANGINAAALIAQRRPYFLAVKALNSHRFNKLSHNFVLAFYVVNTIIMGLMYPMPL